MISTEAALQYILQHSRAVNTTLLNLNEAQGYVLAQTLISPIPFPSFPQSAMDGYALRKHEIEEQNILELQQVVQAGDTDPVKLEKGKAIRIFTGAPVPEGADIVVMQEWIHREGDHISLAPNAQTLVDGMNIRTTGSQNGLGEMVMAKGELLTPSALSFLSGLGIQEVEVYTKPKVAILTTGKELVQPGQPLLYGQIYESNRIGLISALHQMQMDVTRTDICDDDLPSTKEKVSALLASCDVLLITGGVSVGEYDFVTKALDELQVETMFHKVKQKPGKPFYAGRMKNQFVFGLPGNPGSVMTCFYLYVYPALRAMSGHQHPCLPSFDLPCHVKDQPLVYAKKKGLTHFLKAVCFDGQVSILEDQESYKMNSFAKANALVEIPEESEGVKSGDLLRTYLLPY